jgi:hypothetical protein
MKRRDIVIGIVVLILLGGIVWWRQKSLKETTKVPQTLSTEQSLEQKYNIQIPEDVSKAELKDVTGGNASGIVTKDYKNGEFTSSVIADLPAPEAGHFYEAWLSKGEKGSSDYSIISLGTFNSAKGGYLLDFSSKTDYSSYDNAMVTSETKLDNTPETIILQGSF